MHRSKFLKSKMVTDCSILSTTIPWQKARLRILFEVGKAIDNNPTTIDVILTNKT